MTRPPTDARPDHPDGRDGLTTEVVVFDMGGVLVRLASLPELLGVGGDTSDFWPRWLSSPSVRQFERGGDTAENFAERLVVELELQIGPEEFLTNFTAFCTGLYPGAAKLVSEVSLVCRTALLSNTNALHWNGQVDGEVIRNLCNVNFLSFQMGLLKPDAQVFNHVASELSVEPDQILFLDDNQVNVDGALAAGWRAEVATGPIEARRTLAERGVLS